MVKKLSNQEQVEEEINQQEIQQAKGIRGKDKKPRKEMSQENKDKARENLLKAREIAMQKKREIGDANRKMMAARVLKYETKKMEADKEFNEVVNVIKPKQEEVKPKVKKVVKKIIEEVEETDDDEEEVEEVEEVIIKKKRPAKKVQQVQQVSPPNPIDQNTNLILKAM